jgi:hypothetical protein
MRAIAEVRRRFSYRRLHVLLKREGYLVNRKKLFGLYQEESLAVRRRGGRVGGGRRRWRLQQASRAREIAKLASAVGNRRARPVTAHNHADKISITM